MHWLYLAIAITGEVIATSALKASAGFTRLWPSLVVVAGYAMAFYFLSIVLRTIPVGVAYGSDVETVMQIDGISVIGHMSGPNEGAYLVTQDGSQVQIRAQGWDALRK